jgi:uncharacterized membrane protein YfcA
MSYGLSLGYLALGLIIGIISGALGIGGGVLMVPALIWLFGFDYRKATGTSLAVLVMPVVALGAYRYYRAERVDLMAAGFIAAAFLIGAYLGAQGSEYIPTDDLRMAFGYLLLFVALRFIFGATHPDRSATVGLIAVVAAWVAYLVVHTLGRKYVRPPSLPEKIQAAAERMGDDAHDYMI